MPQALLPIFPSGATPINSLLSFMKNEKDNTIWYFHGCMPVFSHNENDYTSFRMITSQMVVLGQCKQMDIVRTFGVTSISVKRHVKKYREEGVAAFYSRQRKTKRATVWTPERLNRAQELFNEGKTRDEIERTLDVKPDTLYRAISAGKLVEPSKKKKVQQRASEA